MNKLFPVINATKLLNPIIQIKVDFPDINNKATNSCGYEITDKNA